MIRKSHTLLLTFCACLTAQADSQFPSYLNQSYCQEIAVEFMTSSVGSLQKYREAQLPNLHRGGMNNIRKFINQRKNWLIECDQFLSATNNRRIFKDDSTTDDIFDAMNSVTGELESLISGVSYSVDAGRAQSSMAEEKFDHLLLLVDNHKTRLQLKGQLVHR